MNFLDNRFDYYRQLSGTFHDSSEHHSDNGHQNGRSHVHQASGGQQAVQRIHFRLAEEAVSANTQNITKGNAGVQVLQ